METTYEFTAFNEKRIYGYGTEDEAKLYLQFLNQGREINLYEMEESSLTDDEADTLARYLRVWLSDLGLIGEEDS